MESIFQLSSSLPPSLPKEQPLNTNHKILQRRTPEGAYAGGKDQIPKHLTLPTALQHRLPLRQLFPHPLIPLPLLLPL